MFPSQLDNLFLFDYYCHMCMYKYIVLVVCVHMVSGMTTLY